MQLKGIKKVEQKARYSLLLYSESHKKDQFWLQRCLDTPLLKAFKS